MVLSGASAQNRWALELQFEDQHTDTWMVVGPQVVPDTLQHFLQQQWDDGYLAANLDTSWVVADAKKITAKVYRGPRFSWLSLATNQVPADWLRALRFREKNWQDNPLSIGQWQQLQDELIEQASDNGYPFTSIALDSLSIRDSLVSAALVVDRGPRIVFDSLRMTGDTRLPQRYLQQLIGIVAGEPFSAKKIRDITTRLEEVPFVRLNGKPAVRFTRQQKAIVSVPLERQPASKFDFVIGVLPNNATTDRLLITGQFEAELYNSLGRGERLYANFEQLRPQTQELELAFRYPYLLETPFGFDGRFDLYRRDTTFLDLSYDMGVQYLYRADNYLKVFWENQVANLLTVDTARIRQSQQLPDQLDLRTTRFGLEMQHRQLDYRYNPRQGWELQLRAAFGTKRILPNLQIDNAGLGGLYDSLSLRSTQTQLRAMAGYFLPLGQNATLLSRVRAGYLLGNATRFRSEQFRLGGNRLLRGFDEEFFFADRYVVSSLEARLLLDRNAYLYSFLDYGFLRDERATNKPDFQPYGFGAGITLETSAGLFGVSLAFGSVRGTPLDFGAPKVHFGYVSLF